MEAASVAWEPLGFMPVGFSEIEPFPCAILKHRFPNTPNYGSLTEYKQWPLEPGAIDLLVGGTPCQSFSVAGLRKGLEDPRGNLALVFLGLADKLKPRWIVWENVPGVLSSAGGRDFGSFLGALVELGYGFAYRVLDAQHFGVPQRRRRVFVVACLGDWRAPAEVLLESDCVRRDTKKGRAKGQGSAAGVESSVDANGLQRTVGTLCADTHPGAYSGQDAYTGRLIPSHWEGGEVHPTLNQSAKGCGSPGYSNQELFSQKGAGLVPGQPVSYILDSFTSNSMLSDNPNSGCREVDMTKCLDTSCLNPACHQGGVMITQSVAIPIQDGREMEKKQNGMGIAQEGDPAYTIDTTGAQAIAIQGTIIGRSENAGPQGVGATEGGPMFTLTKADIHGVATAMAVRRLTPVECERLQGFPDNWSRISWKGKPEEQCPDGPRYKACGNSMAVPVMRWIGERILTVNSKL